MRRGFTLVEMLVAITIFGLIAAGALSVMRATIVSREIAAERLDRLAGLQRMRIVLANDLSQAAPRRVRLEDGSPALYSFRAVTPNPGQPFLVLVRRGWENPDSAPRASLQYVEYRLEAGRLERRVRAPVDGAALGPAQIITQGVSAVEVQAFVQGTWRPGYAAREQDPLPAAVRIDLDIEGYGRVPQTFLVLGAGA